MKKSFKRILALTLSVLMLLSLCGCGLVQHFLPKLPRLIELFDLGRKDEEQSEAQIVQVQEVPVESVIVEIPEAPEESEPVEPQQQPEAAEEPAVTVTEYSVDTVDGLLENIGSDRIIYLEKGSYELSKAAKYGRNGDFFSWRKLSSGYELVIHGVENLTIICRDSTDFEEPAAEILTAPRSASVLRFDNCSAVTLQGLSVGHVEGGSCFGNVVKLENCFDIDIIESKLFGCGTVAVDSVDCEDVCVDSCLLTDCSYSALTATNSRAVVVKNSVVKANGTEFHLFKFDNCSDCAVADCEISENAGSHLFMVLRSRNVMFVSNKVFANTTAHPFYCDAAELKIAGCSFENMPQSEAGWVDGSGDILGMDGNAITERELQSMEYEKLLWELPEYDESTQRGEITVSNVDELLCAIGPGLTITLLPGEYELSAAKNYGKYGSSYYMWQEEFDGFTLRIQGVKDMKLMGAGADEVTICTDSSYADVLLFENCENIELSGFTAGHKNVKNSCVGDVLELSGCEGVRLSELDLFGCGYIGINAVNCRNLMAENCEIYDCSSIGVLLNGCESAKISGCEIYDIKSSGIVAINSNDTAVTQCRLRKVCTSGAPGVFPMVKDEGSRNTFIFVSGVDGFSLDSCSFDEGVNGSKAVFITCKDVVIDSCESSISGWNYHNINCTIEIDGQSA